MCQSRSSLVHITGKLTTQAMLITCCNLTFFQMFRSTQKPLFNKIIPVRNCSIHPKSICKSAIFSFFFVIVNFQSVTSWACVGHEWASVEYLPSFTKGIWIMESRQQCMVLHISEHNSEHALVLCKTSSRMYFPKWGCNV